MIQEDRLHRTFCDLVKIYAPSGGEKDVAAYLKTALKRLGARVAEDTANEKTGGNSGNLIATFAANAEGLPSLAFTGHMDCVENCQGIEPVLEDGVYHSAGDTILGGDDKAGVTAILEALTVMKETMIPHGKITVIFTIHEEDGLGGSKHFDKKYAEGIDFGYVFDSDGAPGTAVIQGPYAYSLTCTMHGKAAHAGVCPEAGINAIKMAAHAVSQMQSGRIDAETTANVGMMEGGLATNIVPDTCTIRAEARSLSEEKLKHVVDDMIAGFKSAEQEFPGGTAEVVATPVYYGFKVEETSPAIRLFRAACAACGATPVLETSNGGSDANWFNAGAFPAILCGCGMTNFHTNEECLAQKDLFGTAALIVSLIEESVHFATHA